MSSPVAYAIDFGTTNSSIAVAYPDRVEVLDMYPGTVMPASLPSIAYLHRNFNRATGTEAVEQFMVTGSQATRCDRCNLVQRDLGGAYSECKQFRPGGGCLDSRLMSGLKSELSDRGFTHTHSWAMDFELEDLTAVVLGDLRRRADRHTSALVRRAVIGRPVVFVGSTGPQFDALEKLATQRLQEAAMRAGFDEVELYPEPAAAVLDEAMPDGILVSVDFGGGTFDVAVVKVVDGEGEVVALQGAAIGGGMFDELIFEHKVAPALALDKSVGEKRLPIPGWFRHRMRSLTGFKHLLTEPLSAAVMTDLARAYPREGALVRSILFGGQAHRFYTAIEDAKIRLSTQSETSIEFHPPALDLSIPLSRSELDAMTAPHLRRVEGQISKALNEAGVKAYEVGTVIRTGGTSQLAAFVALLDRLFGADRVRARPAFTSVAHGLGVVAQDRWA